VLATVRKKSGFRYAPKGADRDPIAVTTTTEFAGVITALRTELGDTATAVTEIRNGKL
jgi:hypothetical protein